MGVRQAPSLGTLLRLAGPASSGLWLSEGGDTTQYQPKAQGLATKEPSLPGLRFWALPTDTLARVCQVLEGKPHSQQVPLWGSLHAAPSRR